MESGGSRKDTAILVLGGCQLCGVLGQAALLFQQSGSGVGQDRKLSSLGFPLGT